MITKKDIENDNRFFINQLTINDLFKRLVIVKYKLRTVEVGKIRRNLFGRTFPLYETEAYKYLLNPEDSIIINNYKSYCEIPDAKKDNSERSLSYFQDFANKFKEEEYDIKKGIIVINQFYCIEEGLHRSCILLKEKGPDYKITVLQLYVKVDSILRSYLGMIKYDIKSFFGLV